MNDRRRLIEELHTGSTSADRCPHLRHVSPGVCQCAAVQQADPASGGEAAALICDYASIQLWCLAGSDRWPTCHFFPQAPGVNG